MRLRLAKKIATNEYGGWRYTAFQRWTAHRHYVRWWGLRMAERMTAEGRPEDAASWLDCRARQGQRRFLRLRSVQM